MKSRNIQPLEPVLKFRRGFCGLSEMMMMMMIFFVSCGKGEIKVVLDVRAEGVVRFDL